MEILVTLAISMAYVAGVWLGCALIDKLVARHIRNQWRK